MALRMVAMLAWRNLWRNYRRTLIMLAAIIVGVWAMIFMTSLMRGMVDEMVNGGVRTLPGHAQIHHVAYQDDPSVVNSFPEPSAELLHALEQPAIVAWGARVKVPAVIASERYSRGVRLLGVDPDSELALGFSMDDIVEGRFISSVDDRGLVIGARLAQRLETELGKRVVVMSQDPENNVADRGFRVVGLFKAEMAAQEETLVYAGRATVQKMLAMGTELSEIAVLGDQYRNLDAWFPSLQQAVGPEQELLSWRELETYLSTMLQVQDSFTLLFMVVVFIALSFGLVNTLMMAVFERIRELGLMQALGMRPALILQQLLMESFFLLSLGLLVGNALAVLTILPLESGIYFDSVSEGFEMFGLSAVLYPVLNARDMLMATTVVIVLGLAASLLPAWRASRLDPVRALGKT